MVSDENSGMLSSVLAATRAMGRICLSNATRNVRCLLVSPFDLTFDDSCTLACVVRSATAWSSDLRA
jgi:hypothetical protein